MSEKMTLGETIADISREHLKNGGLLAGQCLTAVGWVGGTVPEIHPGEPGYEGIVEFPMADVSNGYMTAGMALAGKRPIQVVRYQGFAHFNSIGINNYAAIAKKMWGTPCPCFIRIIGMDAGIGPVASGAHHTIFTRMPGIQVYAPATPMEFREVWERFMRSDDPFISSENRFLWPVDYEMPNIVQGDADIALFPISVTRLGIEQATINLAKAGIKCNVVHLWQLKPFEVTRVIRDALANSVYGGLVIDADYEGGVCREIAHKLMLESGRKVDVLGRRNQISGFAPHFDNVPPTAERIVEKVKSII
ncbi:MAG: hypothetical protein O2794_03155 [bacterium]|nr:hypothetical protein [bacterium]